MDKAASHSVLFSKLASLPSVKELTAGIALGGIVSRSAIQPAAVPFLVALIRRLRPAMPIVVVAEGVKSQELIHQDLHTWLQNSETPAAGGGGTVCPLLYFPAWEILPHESKLPHADVISERLDTLVQLAGYSPGATAAPIVITQVNALQQRSFPPGEIASRSRTIRKGDLIDPLDLVEWLEDQGYEPEAQINHKGEMALRGGILDIFPLTSPWPIRLEFFGDVLESLRWFDPTTQLSRDAADSVTLSPAGELGILKQRQVVAGASNSASPPPQLATLMDHLPAGSLFVLCQDGMLEAQASGYASQLPEGDPFVEHWPRLLEQMVERGCCRLDLEWGLAGLEKSEGPVLVGLENFRPVSAPATESGVADAQRRAFFDQLHRWMRQGYAVQVLCNTDGERQRFSEIWRDYGFTDEGGAVAQPSTTLGRIGRGFLCEEARVVVVTDAEIFGRYKVQRPRRIKSPHAAATRSALDIDFTELEEGDYVVHVQHGIGRFLGLKTLDPAPIKGKGRVAADAAKGEECLLIEYAPTGDGPAPRLYVPVSEAHLVGKYVGTGKARPPLNTLGGTRWAKAKAQAEEAVRDLAAELLSIQAARETQAGYSFSADNTWQREFEGSFLYEETPDQLRAILDAKRDMESSKPMDRLICGDVGYGKTEVAIRAAFKSVMGGKQVAVLVPTTVLAQQHFNTFRERMADYPVRVELLSRFRKPRQIRHVIEQLALGGVDIVIGTHRLLQRDILFKDLGLVVIDEEQRFGVMHKERFKLLRQLVDVLTLSATPIPRTLHLALTGARDMSTIETPPQDRLPVETLVCQYDERIIRDAIQRELNRQGQVFFLHNRIHDIDDLAAKLRDLVPQARVSVGHGQMDPDDLEEVMTRFVNGEVDVLLSTTIIESGIDIPNANTIIIDRADRFGLSDLYQLRGRVGRYKHQAYAYLLLPRHAGLLTDARKRISAIRQYSSLGSGFKIAMRDLEIRGAGNLLGPQQSGHITAVGFELYCQLLKQSVSALKGEKVTPRIDVTVRFDFLAMSPAEESDAASDREKPAARKRPQPPLNISVPRDVGTYVIEEPSTRYGSDEPQPPPRRTPAYIPLAYIRDARQRIDVYRKLAQSFDGPSIKRLGAELRDRFGPLPESLDLLLEVQQLKLLAANKGVTAMDTQSGRIRLSRKGEFVMVGGMFPRLRKSKPKEQLKEIATLLSAL